LADVAAKEGGSGLIGMDAVAIDRRERTRSKGYVEPLRAVEQNYQDKINRNIETHRQK